MSNPPIDPHRGPVAGPGWPTSFPAVEPGLPSDPVAAARLTHQRSADRNAEQASRLASRAERARPAPVAAPAPKRRERARSARPEGTPRASAPAPAPRPTDGEPSIAANGDVTMTHDDWRRFLRAADVAVAATEQQQRDEARRTGRQSFARRAAR